jgi:hypothetical protein
MSDHADTIRAARASLDKIGEGEWTPQDTHCAKLADLADALAARCDALEKDKVTLRGALRQLERDLQITTLEGDLRPAMLHTVRAALAATDTTREMWTAEELEAVREKAQRHREIFGWDAPAGERQET